MKKNITILGSTGSIGTQSLDVCENLGYNVIALSANTNIQLLAKQIRKFSPQYVVITDKYTYEKSKDMLKEFDTEVFFGVNGLCKIASLPENDIVLNSVVGMVGLLPTISAIENHTDVALANKETLVAGGKLVMDLAKANGVKILPVDSEHSAIFQCLQGNKSSQLNKIILTASGGPFFNWSKEELETVTKEKALKHPNWSMGAKITIDSSTLMNKGLEFIEAMNLFSVKPEDIEIVVHRESIVHSAVEYVDGSVIAQIGTADMRTAIQYALTYPDRKKTNVKRFSFMEHNNLTFFKPDFDTFTCLRDAVEASKRGGLYPAIVNGANEQAVKMFLNDETDYTMISNSVNAALNHFEYKDYTCKEEVLEADKKAREFVKMYINNR